MTLTSELARVDAERPGLTHADAADVLSVRLGRSVSSVTVKQLRYRARHSGDPQTRGPKLRAGAAHRIKLPIAIDRRVIAHAAQLQCTYDEALADLLRRAPLNNKTTR